MDRPFSHLFLLFMSFLTAVSCTVPQQAYDNTNEANDSSSLIIESPAATPTPTATPILASEQNEITSTQNDCLIRFTDTFRDYGVDQNQDGRFESLVVEVDVYVCQAGGYNFGATLSLGNETEIHRDIDGVQEWVQLDEGTHSVPLSFGGTYILREQLDGPYQLNNLWVTNIQNPTPIQLRTNLLDSREIAYITSAYIYGKFQ